MDTQQHRRKEPSRPKTEAVRTTSNDHSRELLNTKEAMAHRRGGAQRHKIVPGATVSPPMLSSPTPGSYAIEGPRARLREHDVPSDDDEDDYSQEGNNDAIELGVQSNDNNNVAILAELVDPSEREEELRRVRSEAMQEVHNGAPKAEIFDDTEVKQRRRRMFLLMMCATALSLVVSVVAISVALSRNNKVHFPTLQETIENEFGEDYLDDEESPQFDAFDWMAQNDTFLSLPLESEEDRVRFRQRFVMCVLSFTTNVYEWADRGDWLEPIDECKWFGIICDGDGKLVALSLVAIEGLVGSLPTELGYLSHLKYLVLHENPRLGGTLPSELVNVSSLVSFYGRNNNFEGTIPSEYGELSALEKLDLSGNALTGPVAFELSRMIELVDFDLSFNRLTGTIPGPFWRLVRLETLGLRGNQINGTLPSDMGTLLELRHLDLQDNLLVGPLPEELGFLANLETLQLSGNSLTGVVPDRLCALREDPPLPGLHVLETDCTSEISCACCTRCF